MGYQSLLLDRVDGVATLTMNRPEARNALDIRMREELVEALEEIERDPAMRVVILTGASGHFSAGGDVKTMAARRHSATEGRERVELLNRFVLRLFNFPKPTIAKVEEMVLTGEIIDAAEAFRIGLVNRVVPAAELERTTRTLAGKIAAGPPIAATLAKSLLNRAATVDLAAALEGEAFGQSNAISTEDHGEGVLAFLEKRAPRFQGR